MMIIIIIRGGRKSGKSPDDGKGVLSPDEG